MSLWQVLSLVALLQIGLFQQVLGGNVTCPQPGDCNLQCVYGFEPPTNPDCPSCSCINPCEGYDCGSFEVCRVIFRADIPPPTPDPLTPGAPGIGPNPEPPVATCYPKPECHPLADCSQKCPEGFYKDSGKVLCPNCSCIDPCKAFDCGPSKDCVVRAMWPSGILAEFDIDGPSLVPVCVPRQSIPSTQGPTTELTNTPGPNTCLQDPSMGDCDAVIPRWFFNVSALECQTFQYGGCGGNTNNFVSQSDCLARCLPTSINCPDVPCASPCQLQYNSKGCQICVCPGATCKDFQCPSNEECQIVNGQCSITAQVCHPRPQCLPKTDGTTVYTPPMCPYIECEGMECPYNFKLDQRGCKTCQCYDPCETYECATGQVCAVMPPDCSQGEECRDAPVRYCTEPSPPPILRERPSAEEMMSCCVAENVSARCQPLCIPDLSVKSDLIPVMMQCVDELKSYLKCAGGGASYTSCCKNKGLGSLCYEFCAGNVSIDTTNLHMFSDCLMNDLNDVLLCYQTGMPDVKSTDATAVPTREVTSRMPTSSGDVTSRMSTARLNPADVCTQGMDSGSCEAAMTRWFFNTDTLQCESFMYGGCEGNANNFMTLEDCLAACLIEVPPQCPLVLCEEHCAYVIGADGCTKCVCPESSPSPPPGQSSTQDVSELWRTTRYRPTKDPITPPMSLQQCCIDAGVESQCMPMCSFEFNFDVSSVPALLACQSHLATGLRCAKRDRTYTQCCSQSGVTGQCLESCGSSVNITDYTCLITEHAAMLSCFTNEQTDVECPTMAACDLICPYGNPKDSNGCRVCECLDPCQDANCSEGKRCTYEQYPDCQGDICGLAYRGKCTDTIVQCPDLDALDCHNTCPYGRVKDNDECDTCNCSDPCKDVTCESGYTCKVNKTLDCAGLECMTRYLPTCSVECEQLECGACEFGNVKDVNDCNTCECFDPCKNVTCSEPLVCVPRIIPTLVEEDAVREEFIGECRLKPVCSDLSIGCRRYCEFGFLKNSSGCEICDCFEPCQNVTCTNGTECKPEAVQATKEHPYSAIGKCQAHSNCDITCAMYCEYGMEKDDKGCNLCRCYEPCAAIQCGEGKVCKSEPTTEADNSRYSFKGVCRDKCSPPACNKYCKYGLTRDNNGCEVCECSDPCKDKTCDHVSVCQPRRITESPPHSYIGECVRCSGMLCDIACDYGTVMLTAACPLCECFSPCQNITCRVGQKCEAKPVNITAAYLQMYTGECVDAVCPNVMCSNECQYGYKKTKEGCDTCECSYPCNDTKCLTGYVCEVKTDTNCMSGNCSRIHYAACVPPPRPCARQQQLDIARYSPFDLDLAPLLNCDIDGYYKPLQCDLQDVCRCSTPEGLTKPKYDSLTLQQAIDLCYPDDRIDAKLRVHADYSILRMGNGTFFKQYVSKQLADVLKVPDSNVTITKYRDGSILVDFLVSSVHKHLMDNAWNTIMSLQQTNQMIPVEYNGQHYHGVLEFAERVGPYVTLPTTPEIPPTPRTSKQGGLTRTEFLVIVTVVPIVGGLLLMLIVAICVYKIYMYKRGHDELISDSVRSSMSFDNVMVEKGGRPKSGYENPSYNEVKVKPTGGTFSSNGDITTA